MCACVHAHFKWTLTPIVPLEICWLVMALGTEDPRRIQVLVLYALGLSFPICPMKRGQMPPPTPRKELVRSCPGWSITLIVLSPGSGASPSLPTHQRSCRTSSVWTSRSASQASWPSSPTTCPPSRKSSHPPLTLGSVGPCAHIGLPAHLSLWGGRRRCITLLCLSPLCALL